MYTKEYIEELLKNYHQREREIAVRRFELANFTKLSEDEYIDAANLAKGDGAGHVPGHISNKTLHIALNYREQTERLNTEAVMEINREIEKLELEQRRLRYYVSLLDERQATVIRLQFFERLPIEEIEKELRLTARSLRSIRKKAIGQLAEMYALVPEKQS